MLNKCVIIGDIIGSSRLSDWSTIFNKINTTLKEVNEKFHDNIFINFNPTIGDEFQGALKNLQNAHHIYVFLQSKLPIMFRCGIGIGDIERMSTKNLGMRGTAFYRARSALGLCEEEKRNIFIKLSDIPTEEEEEINTLLEIIEVLKNSWTNRQHQIINYYREHPDYTYEQIAKYVRRISGKGSKQSVSQVLNAANWDIISKGEVLINKLLKNISKAK